MAGRAASMEGWQHGRVVCALYKRLLKGQRDWLVERPLINEAARRTRAVFDLRKNEYNPDLVQKYLAELKAEAELFTHPQPYTIVTDKGGTSWERNSPVPIGFCDPHVFAREYGE